MKYAAVILILFSLLLFACNGDESGPFVPPADPEVICDISGDVSFKYEAQTSVTQSEEDGYFVLRTGGSTIYEGTEYLMTLSFFYENEPCACEMQFSAKAQDKGNYAVGTFEYEQSGEKMFYLASSGSATITSINGNKIKGAFEFDAPRTFGGEIHARNGYLDTRH